MKITFIWDFVAETVLGEIIDWMYGQVIGFFGDFFGQRGNMGVELFEMSWVQSIVLFFSYLAWTLFSVGIVVAAFECAIEYQGGRGSIRDTGLNIIKGFMAVSLFTITPIELYKLSVNLQSGLLAGISGYGMSIDTLAGNIVSDLQSGGGLENFGGSGAFGGLATVTNPILIGL